MMVFLIWGFDSSRNFNLTFPTMRSLISLTEDPMWALQPLTGYADPNCKFMNKVNTHLVGLQTQWTPLITPKPCLPRRRARVTLQVTAHQCQHGQSNSPFFLTWSEDIAWKQLSTRKCLTKNKNTYLVTNQEYTANVQRMALTVTMQEPKGEHWRWRSLS